MKANEYQNLAMRTNDGKATERLVETIQELDDTASVTDLGGVINACLGLSGETGEVCDMIKKAIFHGHELDQNELKKEIGDCCWYLAMMCQAFGFRMEEIMQLNIDKLKARYSEGFSEQASINRKE